MRDAGGRGREWPPLVRALRQLRGASAISFRGESGLLENILFSCVCVSLLYNLHNYRARAVASTVHYGLNNARMEHPTSRSQMRDKAERGTSRPLSPPRASVECLARSAPTDGPDPYTSSCHLSERGREHL